jgi:hypothetical protein
VIALGDVASGVFSNSDALAREVCEAGEARGTAPGTCRCGTRTRRSSKSNFADFPNIGPDGARRDHRGVLPLALRQSAVPWGDSRHGGNGGEERRCMTGRDRQARGACTGHFRLSQLARTARLV